MAQLQKTFLNDQEDHLSILLFMAVQQDSALPGPDDDDWDDDDDNDEFDVETGNDIDEDVDEDWEDPDLVPDTEDEDDELLNENEDSITSETTEGEALESGELDTNFEDRPYTTRRRTGRMVDHEPGTSGFEPPL